MLLRLFNAALWSPAGKGLTSCCDVVTFPFGILGLARNLILSIPGPCCLSFFDWCGKIHITSFSSADLAELERALKEELNKLSIWSQRWLIIFGAHNT